MEGRYLVLILFPLFHGTRPYISIFKPMVQAIEIEFFRAFDWKYFHISLSFSIFLTKIS